MYDTRLVPAHLLALARNTAAALGREWKVLGLLQTAILSHPLGLHCSLNADRDSLRITAFVSTTSDPAQPAEPVIATTPMARLDGATVANVIHSKVLPHFGRKDAIAALRLLSLPLRDAHIPAICQGSVERTEIELRADDGGNPLISLVMTSPRDDAVHVGLLLDRLTVDQAIRCARPAIPAQLPDAEAPSAAFAAEVHSVLDAFPGLNATPSMAGPRFTIVQTPGSSIKIRHDMAAVSADTPLALSIPKTSIATAYAVLRAYTAK
ncbi:hypothetical protein [Streptomyces sp. NPDC002851]